MRGLTIIIGIVICSSLVSCSLIDRYQQFKLYAKEYNKRYESKAV